MLAVDRAVGEHALPAVLRFGEENARTLLSGIATGLLTIVVPVFWVRMLAVQMSTTAVSARVLQGFLRDRFQQMTMGAVVGVLVYVTIVHNALPEEGAGAAAVPHLAVAVACLGMVTTALLILVSVSEGHAPASPGCSSDG